MPRLPRVVAVILLRSTSLPVERMVMPAVWKSVIVLAVIVGAEPFA